MKSQKTSTLIIGLLFLAHISGAQTVHEIDNHLALLLDKVTYWDAYRDDNANISKEDSLNQANDSIMSYLKAACLKMCN